MNDYQSVSSAMTKSAGEEASGGGASEVGYIWLSTDDDSESALDCESKNENEGVVCHESDDLEDDESCTANEDISKQHVNKQKVKWADQEHGGSWSNRLQWLGGVFRGEFLMLMVMSLHSGFGITIFPRILPLVVQHLGYSMNIVNYYFFGFAMFGTVISLLMTSLKLTNAELFASGYASLVAFFFTMTAMCLTSSRLSYVVNQVLLTISTLSWSFYCATTKMFLIVTCNKFVTSSNQSLGESIRANVTMVGRLATAFTTTFVYDNIEVFTMVNFSITVGFFVGMTLMRRTLKAPVASF